MMRCIILNGPCGVGKSTLAKQLHASLPLSFLLDIDALHRYIADSAEDYLHAMRWKLSSAIAESIMETVFREGHSVIIDKMIYDTETLAFYEELAQQYGVEMIEIVLEADKNSIHERMEKRQQERGEKTPLVCEYFWQEEAVLKKNRPKAHWIDTTGKNAKEVYAEVQAYLA